MYFAVQHSGCRIHIMSWFFGKTQKFRRNSYSYSYAFMPIIFRGPEPLNNIKCITGTWTNDASSSVLHNGRCLRFITDHHICFWECEMRRLSFPADDEDSVKAGHTLPLYPSRRTTLCPTGLQRNRVSLPFGLICHVYRIRFRWASRPLILPQSCTFLQPRFSFSIHCL